MDSPLTPRRRRAGALGVLCAATALSLAPVAMATPAADALDLDRAEVTSARTRVEAAAATLAVTRARLDRAGSPAERTALAAAERRAETVKREAIEDLRRAETRLVRTAGATEADPETPAQSERSVVLLPDAQTAEPPPVAAAVATGVIPTPQSGLVAATLDAYLVSKGSPLAGLGEVFTSEAAQAGLDPRLLVAISGAETSFGVYGPSQLIHNPFGLGPGMQFASWADSIHYAAQNLAGGLYLGDGRVTIPAIQARWAPHGASNDPTGLNSNWTRNVSTYYAELGGDPAATVFTGVAATALLAPQPIPTIGSHGADAAQDALRLLGTPHPADQAGGLDAAGLVRVTYAGNDVDLPASPAAQAVKGVAVEPEALTAGDLIFFSTPEGDIVHVGIYLGAGQFIHAPGPGDTVGIGSLYEPQWANAYAGARRV